MNKQQRDRSRRRSGIACRIARVARAALDQEPISGLTHQFYRYPARFSPQFVRMAIEAFSSPGDTVLDPYMGGGTTILEAYATGRRSIGNDVNSLAVFVARVKLAPLTAAEKAAVEAWACQSVPSLRCSAPLTPGARGSGRAPRNMSLPKVRWIKKTISQCLGTIESDIRTARAQRFAKCVVLNVGQWALNGRRRIPTVDEYRERITVTAVEMLRCISELKTTLESAPTKLFKPLLEEGDAENLDSNRRIRNAEAADLVVTSPPYPGIHMLYHRWQVDGRKESDAPFWITGTNDGAGATFYNFADRRRSAEDRYFQKAHGTFSATRSIVRKGATIVQMIAFTEPERQLKRYLAMMERAGFAEQRAKYERRTWRNIPGRRWHANLKGELASSREVLLLHEAV